MILRFPSLIHAMFSRGYLPMTIGGAMHTMPADFLVDSSGVICEVYSGQDEGDHMSFDMIKRFAWEQSFASQDSATIPSFHVQ